jgi:hypothetical protein
MVGRFMVLNATFNNISIISWWSVLLVEEYLEKTTTCHVKALLPIKTKKGIIPQMVVEEGIHIISFRYFIFRIVTVCYFRVYKVK